MLLLAAIYRKTPRTEQRPVVMIPSAPYNRRHRGKDAGICEGSWNKREGKDRKIGQAYDLQTLETGLASWQPQVIELLQESIVNQEPAQWFRSLGESGQHPVRILQDQMKYLGQLIKDLHNDSIKEYWLP